ncbi:MAG: hypothetical protein F6J90_02140 [Moorea sp. SIOASIH]|nr:hypothetical protein [Moorena sp. SIOASIH]NEO35170.1 hypothetical protein [Moorena sp. SIOASIH]
METTTVADLTLHLPICPSAHLATLATLATPLSFCSCSLFPVPCSLLPTP